MGMELGISIPAYPVDGTPGRIACFGLVASTRYLIRAIDMVRQCHLADAHHSEVLLRDHPLVMAADASLVSLCRGAGLAARHGVPPYEGHRLECLNPTPLAHYTPEGVRWIAAVIWPAGIIEAGGIRQTTLLTTGLIPLAVLEKLRAAILPGTPEWPSDE